MSCTRRPIPCLLLVAALLLICGSTGFANGTTTILVSDTPTISKVVLDEFLPTKPGGKKLAGMATLHLSTGDTVPLSGKAADKASGRKVTLKSMAKTLPKVKVTFVQSGDAITSFKLTLKTKLKDLALATLAEPTRVVMSGTAPLDEIQFPGPAGLLRAGDDLPGVLKTKMSAKKTTHSFITVGTFHKANAKITLAVEPVALSKIKVTLSVKKKDTEGVEIEDGGAAASGPWVSTGGPTGGGVYLGITSAGTLVLSDSTAVGPCILRSTDNGATWEDTTGGDRGIGTIHEGPTGTLYVLSDKVLASTDDGRTWAALPSSPGSGTMLAVSPAGHLFLATRYGLYRSKDDGVSWVELTEGLPDSRFLSVHAAPSGVLFASGMTGPYRSTDGGDTWSDVRGTLGASVYSEDMAFPASGDIFFCYSGNDGGVFRSTDGGLTWALTSSGLPSPWTPTMVDAAPNGDLFAASSRYGVLYGSTDGGATWASSSDGIDGTPKIFGLAQDASGGLWAASTYGLYRSTNDGAEWTDANDGVVRTYVEQLGLDDAGFLYARVESGLYRSDDGGATWSHLSVPDVVFTVRPNGLLIGGEPYSSTIWRSTNHGGTWTSAVHNVPRTGIQCLAFRSTTLYAGTTTGVCLSGDCGLTWSEANTGLPANAFVMALVVQPDGDLFAGVSGDSLYRSADGGTTWAALGGGSWTAGWWYLYTDSSGALYAASSTQKKSIIHRSTDDGSTWTEVAYGTPSAFVDAGAEGLFIGHATGIHRSTDGGLTWEDHSGGLSGFTVVSFEVATDGTVYAGTRGAGVFVRE